MKKLYSNLIVNLQDNFISIQKLDLLTLKRVILIVLLTLSGAPIFAQTNSTTVTPPQIMELSTYIASLKTLELNTTTSFSNEQNLEGLLYKIQSSIYFYSGVEKTYGDKPRNLYTDIASLNGLSNSSLLKDNIEIAIIKINASDLNSTIDLSQFSSFTKLKYIYILSNVAITEQDITKMIVNYDEHFNIFYKVDKGE